MFTFRQRIQAGQVRLLEFDRSRNEYTLSIHALADAPVYNALSHVWGSEEATATLACRNPDDSNSSMLMIRPNLQQALSQLARSFQSPIWIDAICINQEDIDEKAAQIPQMAYIYRNAARVITWLGPGENDCDLAMEVIKWLGSSPVERASQRPSLEPTYLQGLRQAAINGREIRYTETAFTAESLPPLQHPLWPAIGHLYNRSWMTRVWIFQEVMLASSCTVMCGSSSVSWRAFKVAADALVTTQLLFHALSFTPQAGSQRPINPLRVFDTQASDTVEGDMFFTHINALRSSNATYAADRVYGVLALAAPKIRQRVPLEYAGPENRDQYWLLYIVISRLLFETTVQGSMLTGSTTASTPKHASLPSWCPDYSQRPDCVSFCANASAGFGVIGVQLWLPPDNFRIRVGGIVMDNILQKTSQFPGDWPQREMHRIYGSDGCAARYLAWLDECLALVTRNITDPDQAHDTFCRTLVGELQPSNINNSGFPANHRDALPALRNRLHMLSRMASPAPNAETGLTEADWTQIQPLFKWLGTLWAGRTFFSTEKGRFGFAHKSTIPGDTISIFYRMTHPQVLRRTEVGASEATPGVYEYISEAYVGGLMVGEAQQELRKRTPQVFELV